MIETSWNKYEVSLASATQIRRPSSEIKFRVVEVLKTPRFSTAIGSNLYAEDRVEYFSVFLVVAISATVPASVAALSTYYYYFFLIPQVVKIPGVKNYKS